MPSATTGWNSGNGANVNKLTDGIHGGTFTGAGSIVAGAWTTVGVTAEYTLGTGTGGTGSDISSIQSIAACITTVTGTTALRLGRLLRRVFNRGLVRRFRPDDASAAQRLAQG